MESLTKVSACTVKPAYSNSGLFFTGYITIRQYALLGKKWHYGLIGEQIFMFNKKGEMDHKWRSALSSFRALLHYASKEETAQHKLQKTRRAYIEERVKQQEHLNKEVARLDKLLKENSIDEDTHARLNMILEMGYEQKRQETRKKYGFIRNPDGNAPA
jgi:hypothetical protein